MLIKLILITIFLFLNFGNAKDLKKVSLQLQWKYQFQFAGYIMAKEKGFYKDIGLDVDIKEWHYNIDMVEEIIKQESQYAIVRPSSLIDIAKGKDIIYLAAIFQSSPLVLLSNKSSNITTIQDFKNKRIMTTGDLNTDSSILSMIYSQGIKLEDLIIQKPSFNPKDLLNNKTDIMTSYISNEPFVLKELGGEPVIFDPKDYGFNFYNDFVATTKSYLNKNQQEVKKFKEATLKGWRYAFSNVNETVDIIIKKYNTQNKSKKALLYEAKELRKLAFYKTEDLGKIETKKLEKIYDVYKLLGLINKDINFNSLIYNEKSIDIKLTTKEKEYLKNKEVINICIDPNWMPYESFNKKDEYIGISADYYKLFEQTLDTKFNPIKTSSFNQSIAYVKENRCDILSLVMETPKRKKYLNFTKPYLDIPIVIATKIDVPFIDNLNKLSGKKLGVVQGHAFSELLKNRYPYLDIVEVKNIDDGLDKVSSNEIFAYIGALSSIGYKLQTKYQGSLIIAGKIDNKWEHSIGVNKQNTILLNILQKAINNITSQQKREILNKWIAIEYKKEVDYEIVIKIIIIFSIILIIVLYFYLKQKELKDKIEEQKYEFETIFNTSKDGIAILDKESKFLNFNEAYLSLTGFTKEELLKTSCLELTSPDDRQRSAKALKEVFDGKTFNNFEKTCIIKDGKKIIVNMSMTLLPDKKRILISSSDITLIKQTQEQAKLVSMGEMIGNIAHQWRQPLSVISTAITGMKMEKEFGILKDEKFYNVCDIINNNVQYLSKTIDDFRDFIKGDSISKNIYIKEVIQSVLNILSSSLKNNYIDVILDIDDDIQIMANKNELAQALINIVNNAKDVLIQNQKEQTRIVRISTKKLDNNTLELKISDNGGGIPSNIISQIFEPYFTTKHKSQGTGLGLSMVYKIITSKYKQFISVQNEEIKYKNNSYIGASFKIIFTGLKKDEK